MRFKILLMMLFLMIPLLSGQSCGIQVEPPTFTACGTNGAYCIYDHISRQSASLIDFRPTSRWSRTTLTWRLAKSLSTLDQQGQLDAISQALARWSEVSSLTFERVERDADITISFENSDLGDGTRFDGPEGIMGRAYFPGTRRGGLIQFDADEEWTFQAEPGRASLVAVALHEIGHALGLEHSLDTESVMAPGYDGSRSILSESDIVEIRRRYGSEDGFFPPIPIPRPGQFTRAPPNFDVSGDEATDQDSDGDGIPDSLEKFALNTDPNDFDSDEDGVSDYDEIFRDGTLAAACPEAIARADRLVFSGGRFVTLDGRSSTEPNGLPLKYQWRQVSGPVEVALSATNTATPAFTAPRFDSNILFGFELTVNNGACSDSDVVSILILGDAISSEPIADAGRDQTVEQRTSVTLDGTGSVDPSGLALSYEWSQTDGPTVILSNSVASTPTFTAPRVNEATLLTFRLDVSNGTEISIDRVEIVVLPFPPDTDGDGLSDVDEVSFYGTDPDNPDTDNDGIIDAEDSAPTNRFYP